MSEYYEFNCGCKWPILKPAGKPGQLPLLDFDAEQAPTNCPATWELLSKGLTKGIFQLESNLGRKWCKELKPENIEHMGALGSILRPGTLNALDDNGISMTKHYCMRKNNEEAIGSLHPEVDKILNTTYNVIIYQETAMKVASELAGFDKVEVDKLRKAIGKKVQKDIASLEEKFLDGIKKLNKVPIEVGKQLWDWIKKSGRYSFNKCLSLDTTVETTSGIKLITDIKIGDKINSIEGWTEVKNIYYNGEQELFLLNTNNHYVKCTWNHEIMCSDYVKRKLVYIMRQRAQHIICKNKIEEIQAWTQLGSHPTIDLEVSNKSHSFYANGISVGNSHAISYGITGYESAYIKAHFPLAFFTAWLANADKKQDPLEEISLLIEDAKLFDIVVETPDLRYPNKGFSTNGETIKFGFTDIKGIGDSVFIKLQSAIKESEIKLAKPIGEFTWIEILNNIWPHISTSALEKIIQTGALKWIKEHRQKLLAELNIWDSLTDKEREFASKTKTSKFIDTLNELAKTKKEGGGCHSKNRVEHIKSQIQMLENPPSPLVDSPHWISWIEDQLLGISITCNKIDSCDISAVNTTCKDFLAGKSGYLIFGAEIKRLNEYKTKKGKTPGTKMAFMSISDGTCTIDDCVVFGDVYKEYESILTEGNTVILHGERGQKDKSSSLIVKKVWQAA